MEGDDVDESKWPKKLLINYGDRHGSTGTGVYTRVEPAVLKMYYKNVCVEYKCACNGKSIFFQDAKRYVDCYLTTARWKHDQLAEHRQWLEGQQQQPPAVAQQQQPPPAVAQQQQALLAAHRLSGDSPRHLSLPLAPSPRALAPQRGKREIH